MKLSTFVKKYPLVLPNIVVDDLEVGGWRFTISTYDIEGKEPYLVYEYRDPNSREYIFHSKTLEEMAEYLEEYKINNLLN